MQKDFPPLCPHHGAILEDTREGLRESLFYWYYTGGIGYSTGSEAKGPNCSVIPVTATTKLLFWKGNPFAQVQIRLPNSDLDHTGSANLYLGRE